MYVHELPYWPKLSWDKELLFEILAEVKFKQGKLVGKMESLGFDLQSAAQLETITLEVVKSSEIEGELFSERNVRSSVASHLGMDIGALPNSDRNIEGVVDMMMDATQNAEALLTAERLFGWHAALFPTGYSGKTKITVGRWRVGMAGAMRVVSGRIGKEKVHFEAPAASKVAEEMQNFLIWFNNESRIDPIIKAAVAHFWFLTIHPFPDGNGRIARAIAEMQLSRADGTSKRFYSMSAQIQKQRKSYYAILEKCQKSTLNITDWIVWFLDCLLNTFSATQILISAILFKSQFLEKFQNYPLNSRQKLMLNKLLDGFDGKLQTSKWAAICKCSSDTALRDIQELVQISALKKESAEGRSTSYKLGVL